MKKFMPSISRSGGQGGIGDSLKDFGNQDGYRKDIQSLLVEHYKGGSRGNRESEENIVLLFRKLREGVSSSGRADTFAIEVYETSAFVSIIFGASSGATDVVFQNFVPDLYLKHDKHMYGSAPPSPNDHSRSHSNSPSPTFTSTEPQRRKPRDHRVSIAFIFLLQTLLTKYPSQTIFYERLKELSSTKFLPADSPHYRYITQLAKAMRERNYYLLDKLTRTDYHVLAGITHHRRRLRSSSLSTEEFTPEMEICSGVAIMVLVNAIRDRLREVAWAVLHHAYNEFGISNWVGRSLLLTDESWEKDEKDEEGNSKLVGEVEKWLVKRQEKGELVRKEGGNIAKWKKVRNVVPVLA